MGKIYVGATGIGKNLAKLATGTATYSTTVNYTFTNDKTVKITTNYSGGGGGAFIDLITKNTQRWAWNNETIGNITDQHLSGLGGTFNGSISASNGTRTITTGVVNLVLYVGINNISTNIARIISIKCEYPSGSGTLTPIENNATFNLADTEYIKCIGLYTQNITFDNAEIKIQIEKNSSATAWEPYTENMPNKARNVTKAYVGINDIAKEVTKVYIGVNNKARLVYPDLYEIVNNLESTGTQYINTGVKVAKDIKMELDLKFNTLSADTQANGGYFQESGTSYKNYILLLTSDNINWDFTLGVWNKQKTIANADTNRHTFSIDCVNGECSLDQDVYTLSNISGDYTGTNDILLFARSMSNGSVIAHASQTLYGTKIWKNNVLVRNFVPAKRKTDNVLGLLDTITNTFYENQGTGTFSIEQ